MSLGNMAKRPQHDQSCHDSSVRPRAAQYETLGYKVMADLPEWETKPPKLCHDGDCAIPDIYAEKGKSILVIEVETPKSMSQDKKQHKILRVWGEARKNVDVRVRTCNV